MYRMNGFSVLTELAQRKCVEYAQWFAFAVLFERRHVCVFLGRGCAAARADRWDVN